MTYRLSNEEMKGLSSSSLLLVPTNLTTIVK